MFGNKKYVYNIVMAIKNGDKWYNPDGTLATITPVNNVWYKKDGTVTTKVGNTWIKGDGSTTTKIGKNTYIKSK